MPKYKNGMIINTDPSRLPNSRKIWWHRKHNHPNPPEPETTEEILDFVMHGSHCPLCEQDAEKIGQLKVPF